MKKWIYYLMGACALILPLWAEDGVSDGEIKLGQSCALDGPAAALGQGMKAGLDAYLAKINEAGGVNGKKISLVSLDDGYEPDKAITNTKKLIEEEKVFLLIGEVGTPTSKAVVPIAEDAKVPFVAPFTGAEFLRNPYKKYVINVRGSYYQEMERLAAHFVDKKGFKNIACFYQNDGYGQAGLSGIKIALEKRGMQLCAEGNYERNTTAVKGALLSIKKGNPEAIIMVGAYKPCAEFIKLCKKVGMKDTVYCNISFVGTAALMEELGDAGEGCVISQVVRFPWDESVALVKEHNEAMKKYQPEAKAGFITLEGYMAGKFFCDALAKVEGEVTREKFIEVVGKTGTFDLGGVFLTFGENDHQGMDDVFLTVIKDGKIQVLEE